MKPTCIVSCPVDTFSGYGHRSRDFVRALIKAKPDWNIQILPQKWGNTPWGFLSEDDELRTRFIHQLTQQPEIWIQISVPNEFQPVGKFNIGVTAGIESTVPPPEFVEGCNRMNLNLVSSNFTKDVFKQVSFVQNDQQGRPIRNIQLEKPIEVLFEGLDTTEYYKDPSIKTDILKDIPENFCFLYTGHWLPGAFGEDRKNVATLIKTFIETFKGKGVKPALLLKTNKVDYSLLDKEDVLNDIRKIQSKYNKEEIPNIYILHGEFTNEELNQINNDSKVKAFVSFTKGEGFGRPLLEQAVTGKPVITTNWSGHTDFIRPEYNILINGELDNIHSSAANQFLIREAKWFNINTEAASIAMKNVYKNYKKYIDQSRKQTKFLNENFSFERMTQVLKTYMDNVNVAVNVPLQMPKLQLPKLKKIGEEPKMELPKITLPKLTKVNG
jgi:glycosyltransferase involved in cell wall biosynthesis